MIFLEDHHLRLNVVIFFIYYRVLINFHQKIIIEITEFKVPKVYKITFLVFQLLYNYLKIINLLDILFGLFNLFIDLIFTVNMIIIK
jgi:hypothetical protein